MIQGFCSLNSTKNHRPQKIVAGELMSFKKETEILCWTEPFWGQWWEKRFS